MNNEEKSLLAKIIANMIAWPIAMVIGVVLGAFGMLYTGFIASKIWLWYVIPTFPMAPVLGAIQFTGFYCLFTVLRGYDPVKIEAAQKSGNKTIWKSIFFESILLLIAFVLKKYLHV